MRFCKYIANERQSRGKVGESSACRDKQFNAMIAGERSTAHKLGKFCRKKKNREEKCSQFESLFSSVVIVFFIIVFINCIYIMPILLL